MRAIFLTRRRLSMTKLGITIQGCQLAFSRWSSLAIFDLFIECQKGSIFQAYLKLFWSKHTTFYQILKLNFSKFSKNYLSWPFLNTYCRILLDLATLLSSLSFAINNRFVKIFASSKSLLLKFFFRVHYQMSFFFFLSSIPFLPYT